MMLGRPHKSQRAGKPITARQINQGNESIERIERGRGGSGLGTVGMPFGQTTRPGSRGERVGMTSDDGIPARSTSSLGMATDVTDVGLFLDDSGTCYPVMLPTMFTCYNLSSQEVQPNTYIVARRVSNIWLTGWEDCPS